MDSHVKYAHLYTVAVEKDARGERKARRLTSGSFHVRSFDWSPDGRTIVFDHQSNPTADVWPTTDISHVPADSGSVTSLVAWKGADTNPRYSPDGKLIAFESDGGDSRWARHGDLYVIPASGGEPRKLAETQDRNFGLFDWAGDGKEVYVTETDRISVRVYAVPLGGGKPRVVATGIGTYSGPALSKDGTTISFIHQTTEVAPDVYISGTRKFDPKKLSDVNADFPKLSMGRTEVITWKSKDGLDMEGLLTYPIGYEKGKRYPLVLRIHGGPAGVFIQSLPLKVLSIQSRLLLRRATLFCVPIRGEAPAMAWISGLQTSMIGGLVTMRMI